MSAKRPAENEIKKGEEKHSSSQHKRSKTENRCKRCFIELTENCMKTQAGDYCPKCHEELKKESHEASVKPSDHVELIETLDETPESDSPIIELDAEMILMMLIMERMYEELFGEETEVVLN